MLAKDLKLDCEKMHIVLYALELWLSITQPFDNTVSRQIFNTEIGREGARVRGCIQNSWKIVNAEKVFRGTLKTLACQSKAQLLIAT